MIHEIDIGTFIKVLKKRKIIIIIAVLITTLITSMYYSLSVKPKYSSSVTFILERTPIIDFSVPSGTVNITFADTVDGFIATSIGLIKTNDILNTIITRAGYLEEISTSDLLNMITIEQQAGTALFTLKITGTDKDVVYQLALKASEVIPTELTNKLQAKVNNVDSATPDTHKTSSIPLVTVIVFDLLAFCAIYVMFVVLELFNSTVYTEDELKNCFTFPVIGQIVHMKLPKNKTAKAKKIPSHNLMVPNNKTPFAVTEGFNNIRAKLILGSKSERCPVFAITSDGANAGKSFVISNIAISFAKINKKVLLIDADMRSPKQKDIFDIKAEKGLSELLASSQNEAKQFSNYINTTSYENLDIITSGNALSNPSDLILSDTFGQLCHYAKENYDTIFIDLPSVDTVSDAYVVANLVNGYLFTVKAGSSNTKEIENALDTMKLANANIVGFVLNNINPKNLKK